MGRPSVFARNRYRTQSVADPGSAFLIEHPRMQQRRGFDLAHRRAITIRWERRRGGEHLGGGESQVLRGILGHGHLGAVATEVGEEISQSPSWGHRRDTGRRQSRLGDGLTDAQ